MAKVEHWCGFQAVFARDSSWMLGLVLFALAAPSPPVRAESSSVPTLQMRIDVNHGNARVFRGLTTVTPLEPFYNPVVLENGEPAVLRCESKFIEARTLRTSCQFLSGNEKPAFSKMRWADSPIGGEGKISFQDLQGKNVDVFVAPLKPGHKS